MLANRTRMFESSHLSSSIASTRVTCPAWQTSRCWSSMYFLVYDFLQPRQANPCHPCFLERQWRLRSPFLFITIPHSQRWTRVPLSDLSSWKAGWWEIIAWTAVLCSAESTDCWNLVWHETGHYLNTYVESAAELIEEMPKISFAARAESVDIKCRVWSQCGR